MNDHPVTRRDVLKRSSAAVAASWIAGTAPAVLAAKGANETLGIGVVGIGTRGGDLLKEATFVDGAKITAVCDVYKPHLKKGADWCKNPDVKAYGDYQELLADKNVDVVIIGTPDHWHAPITIAAANAKKDIYCEKGWGRSLADAKAMRAAVKENKVVFQLGHQARSATCAILAKQLIKDGALGPLTMVRTGRFMNSDPAHPMWRWYGYYGRWERPDPAEVVKNVDWDRWLGSAPKRPFDEGRFWHWRCYWDYGTGIAGDLLSHEMDFVQYLLGYGVPDTCMTTGMNSLLKDGREVPDTWNAVYHFEKQGVTASFDCSLTASCSTPVTVLGKEGSIRFNGIAHDATNFALTREGFNGRADLPDKYKPGLAPQQPTHMQDFFNCVRSRQKPKCHEDEAFIETATLLMSIKSYQERREVRWDAAKEEIV